MESTVKSKSEPAKEKKSDIEKIAELTKEIDRLIESRRTDDNIIIDRTTLDTIKMLINEAVGWIRGVSGNISLTENERRRLQGTRARRYGFIDRLADIAAANMRYAPADWDVEELQKLVDQIELLRNIEAETAQFDRMVKDELLITNNEAYRMALLYYGSVKNHANLHDAGAKALFKMLQEFFTLTRTATPKNSKKNTKRKFNALMDGKLEGKMTIENENEHVVEGKQVIVDLTHRPDDDTFRETAEGAVCGQCQSVNAAHAKFCNNCGHAF